jgi:hypothetical protein
MKVLEMEEHSSQNKGQKSESSADLLAMAGQALQGPHHGCCSPCKQPNLVPLVGVVFRSRDCALPVWLFYESMFGPDVHRQPPNWAGHMGEIFNSGA